MQLEFEIPLLVVLIGLSGFFSGLEVALVGVRISKIEQMVKDKVKGASSLLKLKTIFLCYIVYLDFLWNFVL